MTRATAVHPDLRPPQPLDATPGQWCLDPGIAFLNHGCFGARTRAVVEAQDQRRREFEARPIEFLGRGRGPLIDRAKEAVARLLGARARDLGFVTNATGGINAVLRSLHLKAGDELLTTTHVYNAVRQSMRFVAGRCGGTYREVHVPLPLRSRQAIVDAVAGALGPATRLLVIDHVTSPTAIVMPVREIIAAAEARGIDVLVDGAHAPGMLDLSIEALAPAYYAGNLHKWVSAPPGTGFLWVRPDRQNDIHPLTISHHYGEGLAAEFAWQGTRDISGWLSCPDAMAYFERLGWERVRRHNHQLATWAHAHLCQGLGVEPASPLDGSLLGSMATVALPGEAQRFGSPEALQAVLYDRHQIEVPVLKWSERWWTRVSCHVYNRPEEYDRLADALIEELKRTRP
jgi:isopenicillin-N epimerase